MYSVTGGWQEPAKFYCENCLKEHAGRRRMAIDPDWNTPAKLDDLPVRHWKRRTGYTERTVAHCT